MLLDANGVCRAKKLKIYNPNLVMPGHASFATLFSPHLQVPDRYFRSQHSLVLYGRSKMGGDVSALSLITYRCTYYGCHCQSGAQIWAHVWRHVTRKYLWVCLKAEVH